jgi:glycosyltransferase involved in cell wall biosynthesis
MQALASEVPIVGSDVGGIPSVIEHGKTGRLVPPGDDAALATAIRETLSHPDATRKMTSEGRRRAVERHSVAVMADALEALYARHLPG